ncbi:cyclin-dependent kinase 17-like X3 [Biomphalaria pfeifferi]|uniref:Cyclin-dependent kinase 17-like X3 n=1 Tax=Biomphalaria pfeifferi TaxID=112525 RepID=A0AAD8B933_BIOPF|nr:cyclin-dependent kinase 17-like X3 [Biomphalaria pfeifferi]
MSVFRVEYKGVTCGHQDFRQQKVKPSLSFGLPMSNETWRMSSQAEARDWRGDDQSYHLRRMSQSQRSDEFIGLFEVNR